MAIKKSFVKNLSVLAFSNLALVGGVLKFRKALILALLCQSSYASSPAMIAADNFGEVAGLYIGVCESLKYLKQTSCPKISLQKEPEVCLQDIVNLIPPAGKGLVQGVIVEQRPQLKQKAKESIPIGFKKVLDMAGGDKQRACDVFGGLLLGFAHSQFEELKRLSKLLPNSGW